MLFYVMLNGMQWLPRPSSFSFLCALAPSWSLAQPCSCRWWGRCLFFVVVGNDKWCHSLYSHVRTAADTYFIFFYIPLIIPPPPPPPPPPSPDVVAGRLQVIEHCYSSKFDFQMQIVWPSSSSSAVAIILTISDSSASFFLKTRSSIYKRKETQ